MTVALQLQGSSIAITDLFFSFQKPPSKALLQLTKRKNNNASKT